MKTISTVRHIPRGQASELTPPQGQAAAGNRICAPGPIGTGPRRRGARAFLKLGNSCSLPQALSLCLHFPARVWGQGWEEGMEMGGGTWPRFHRSLRVKYLISSPNVTTLSHGDRGHFTALPCLGHAMNHYFS